MTTSASGSASILHGLLGQRYHARVAPRAAGVTFADDVTLHLNGDEIHVFHVPPAHTDGDAIVHFRGHVISQWATPS